MWWLGSFACKLDGITFRDHRFVLGEEKYNIKLIQSLSSCLSLWSSFHLASRKFSEPASARYTGCVWKKSLGNCTPQGRRTNRIQRRWMFLLKVHVTMGALLPERIRRPTVIRGQKGAYLRSNDIKKVSNKRVETKRHYLLCSAKYYVELNKLINLCKSSR